LKANYFEKFDVRYLESVTQCWKKSFTSIPLFCLDGSLLNPNLTGIGAEGKKKAFQTLLYCSDNHSKILQGMTNFSFKVGLKNMQSIRLYIKPFMKKEVLNSHLMS